MKTIQVIYLLLSIYETCGQLTSKNKALEATNELASTTSDKVSNVLRDILNQESLVRFSMVQKIQSLMLDVTDNKNDVEFLKKKLNDVTKELQTLKVKSRQMEYENVDMKQTLNNLYLLSDRNNRSIETMKTWSENFSLILDEIHFAQNVSNEQQHPSDCKELHDMGRRTSGVYSIYPWDGLSDKSVEVFCDMVTSGGGWTVIQNRVDGKVNFNRNWQEYKAGFGDVSTSHWAGNDIIHHLTKANSSSLHVSITGKNGNTLFIQYDTFSISGEEDDYRLYIAGNAKGTLEDRIRYGSTDNINGMKFSTYDKDNDPVSGSKCTDNMGIGGWWFNNCNDAYLNGPYALEKWKQPWDPPFKDGSYISRTRMMIKRKMI